MRVCENGEVLAFYNGGGGKKFAKGKAAARVKKGRPTNLLLFY